VYGDPNQPKMMQQQPYGAQQPQMYYDPNQPQMQQQPVYVQQQGPQPVVYQQTTTTMPAQQPQGQTVVVVQSAPQQGGACGPGTVWGSLGCAIALLTLWCVVLLLDIVMFAIGAIGIITFVIWLIIDVLLVAFSAWRVHLRRAQTGGLP